MSDMHRVFQQVDPFRQILPAARRPEGAAREVSLSENHLTPARR
ncbi:MAG: hypothetical protein R3B07_17860 [Polyangiaceae bacterium]